MADTQTPTEASLLSNSANIESEQNAAARIDTNDNGVDEPPLFSPSLISPDVSSILPDGYTMRPLRRSDYDGGMQSVVIRTGHV